MTILPGSDFGTAGAAPGGGAGEGAVAIDEGALVCAALSGSLRGRWAPYQTAAAMATTTTAATSAIAGACDFFGSSAAAGVIAATGTGRASETAIVIPASVLPAPGLAGGGAISVGSDDAVG